MHPDVCARLDAGGVSLLREVLGVFRGKVQMVGLAYPVDSSACLLCGGRSPKFCRRVSAIASQNAHSLFVFEMLKPVVEQLKRIA